MLDTVSNSNFVTPIYWLFSYMQLPSEILYHVQTKHHITCLISYLIGLCDELMYHMMQETRVQSLGWADPLEEGKATHSSILAWRIPWTEELGGLQCIKIIIQENV